MQDKIDEIVNSAIAVFDGCTTERALDEAKSGVFGKNGSITALLKGLKDVPNDQKPVYGKAVNDARIKLESYFDARAKKLHGDDIARSLANEKVDITIDGESRYIGSMHPINIVRSRLTEYFANRGYLVYDSPEIESDYYNFQALNIPLDHPSRDMQDTFFISDSILLRSQTSAGQVRLMENVKPPLKMICPGRTYRSDDDATHSPVFHQLEALVVDKNVTMCDLLGTLSDLGRFLFGADTKTRFRPSFFPFTEPSVEVDVSCPFCHGAGCNVCKHTGWIEILGSGIVNRVVLKNCGIDPDEYTGFAFGMGLDRVTMIIYGINDLKTMWENDVRFLRQFGREN